MVCECSPKEVCLSLIVPIYAEPSRGIVKIRAAQQNDGRTAMNINLSASAAFLASVTATTLQYGQVNVVGSSSPRGLAVTTLAVWYISLAFAVTSALLSLLNVIIRLYPR